MPSLMTTADLAIDYAPTPSGFDYRVSLDGLWVASATTFHAGDLVADEVRYRMFLNDPAHAVCDQCGETLYEEGLRYCRVCRDIPDEPPPDDDPSQDGDIDGIPQG